MNEIVNEVHDIRRSDEVGSDSGHMIFMISRKWSDSSMIVNTGQRTDIPAYFSTWFYNRIRAGEVLVRNPYYPTQVGRYRLTPEVVDCLSFCTKNPAPMISRLQELDDYPQLWYVTITPYGKDIEPNVPEWERVIHSFQELSECVGHRSVIWRYDPVLLLGKYDVNFHKELFLAMCKELSGYTDTCVISFIQLYEKTKKNFHEVGVVPSEAKRELTKYFVKVGQEYGMRIKGCCVEKEMAELGIDTSGCATKEVYERALGEALTVPSNEARAREECNCLLGYDIGVYNTCMHGCRYCYANYDMELVKNNMRLHDPESPLLIGQITPADQIYDAKQIKYSHGQMVMTELLK